jgi:Leucine-rich repeat (LRR) protein
LADGSNRHHNLSILDLSFNLIGDIGCESLAFRCISGNYNLKKLSLAGNQVECNGVLSIAAAISNGTGLQRLNLTANQVSAVGMNALAEAIVTNQTQMIHVVSNNNGNGGDIVVRPMEELYLGSASITSDGFSAIPPMIFGNTSLRRLSLSDNHLVDQDITHLSLALEQNKQITLGITSFII